MCVGAYVRATLQFSAALHAPPFLPLHTHACTHTHARRLVVFSNGTRKLVLPAPAGGAEAQHGARAAATTLIAFVNGDLKHTLPGGSTEYFYAEVR